MEGQKSIIHTNDNRRFTRNVPRAMSQTTSQTTNDAQPSEQEDYILNKIDQICDEHIAEVAKLSKPREWRASSNPDDDARAAKRFRVLNPPTPESLEEETVKNVSAKQGETQENDQERRREINELCQSNAQSDDEIQILTKEAR